MWCCLASAKSDLDPYRLRSPLLRLLTKRLLAGNFIAQAAAPVTAMMSKAVARLHLVRSLLCGRARLSTLQHTGYTSTWSRYRSSTIEHLHLEVQAGPVLCADTSQPPSRPAKYFCANLSHQICFPPVCKHQVCMLNVAGKEGGASCTIKGRPVRPSPATHGKVCRPLEGQDTATQRACPAGRDADSLVTHGGAAWQR